jgi:hypothetical protein
MDFADTPAEAPFRAEVRDWLATHLTGEGLFAPTLVQFGTRARRRRVGDHRPEGVDHAGAPRRLELSGSTGARRSGPRSSPSRASSRRCSKPRASTVRLGPEASIGKLYWTTWHKAFGETAMKVLGADALTVTEAGPGVYEMDELERIFLTSRAETIYAGASEIQRNILGERVLGLPREPR